MKINKDRIQNTEHEESNLSMSELGNAPQMQGNTPGYKVPKKGNGNLVFLLIGLFVLLLLVLVIAFVLKVRSTNIDKGLEESTIVTTVVTETPKSVEPINNEVVEPTEPIEPTEPTDPIDHIEPVEEVETFDYDNKMLGLRFNYPNELYIQENTEEMFNQLKLVAGDDGYFDLYTDKLTELVNLMKFTTGNGDTLYITVSIIPFSLTSEVTEYDQTVEVSTLLDDEMLKIYDNQVKDTLIANDCTIDIFEQSVIREVNGKKLIVSERKYSDKSGSYDIIQGLMPLGINAVLVTATTDGNPIALDKVTLFNEIVDSINFVTPDKLEMKSK